MSDDMMILYMNDLVLFPQLPNQVTTFISPSLHMSEPQIYPVN